jgi:hypothetical protein
MAESNVSEWKRLGKAALVAVPVVIGAYGFWYLRNYLSLKKLDGYTAKEGEQRNKQIVAFKDAQTPRKLQFRYVDVDGCVSDQCWTLPGSII